MDVQNKLNISDLNNIKYLCRVCLTESNTMISLNKPVKKIFEKNITIIRHVLSKVSNSTISYNEKYPAYICPMCMGILNIAYKFQLQFEESQKLIRNYFGKDALKEESLKGITAIGDGNQKKIVPVELISKQGRYDLQDLLIVEAEEDEQLNFSGFLQKLGNEISATFVNETQKSKKPYKFNANLTPVVEICRYNENISDNYKNQTLNVANENDDISSKETVKCYQCQKLFSNKNYLKRHVEYVHLRKKGTFMCEICGVLLKSRSSRYYHMLTHFGKRQQCNICHKTYFSVGNLQQHIKAVHKNERLHLCTACGKSFNYANALEYHMRIHSGEKKYKCTYCEKRFSVQCGLTRHLRIHTGNRPYKCKYCEKAFRSKGEVDCHEMTHTGFRPYHCKYCKKGFTKTHNLKVHLLGHSGDYDCKICNKSFIELSILKVHMKSNHSIPEMIDGTERNNEDIELEVY